MIVFGHNNFLIKSYKPSELGIPEEEDSGIQLQVRQRYAHLFWIPFFPIGKAYVIKQKGSSDLYNVQDNVKKLMLAANNGSYPTKWYSFAFPILALVVGIFIVIGDKVSDSNRESRFYKEVHDKKGMIDYPTTGDYYLMESKVYSDSRSNDVVFKVDRYTGNSVTLISGYEDIDESLPHRSRAFLKHFDKVEGFKYNEMTISKTDLKNLVDSAYYGPDSYDFDWQKIPSSKSSQLFKISEIHRRRDF